MWQDEERNDRPWWNRQSRGEVAGEFLSFDSLKKEDMNKAEQDKFGDCLGKFSFWYLGLEVTLESPSEIVQWDD